MKFLAFIVFFFIITANHSYAQEFHLSIEPTVIQIDATPPAKFQTPFRIKNLSSSSIKLESLIVPIESREDGKINLLLDKQNDLSALVKKRLAILSEGKKVSRIELLPGETKVLTLFMDVIEGDPVGDYYFSLIFKSEGTALDETSNSAIPAGIAMNILVSIGPKIDASGDIEEFSTKKIVGSGPILFNLKIANTGKHLIQPKGSITIKNVFGKQVGKIELLPQYVLSKSSRYLVDSTQASPSAENAKIIERNIIKNPVSIWPESFLLGVYTAEVKIELEENGAIIKKRLNFFALPIKLIIIISGIIFIVLGVALRINAKLNKKPRI